MPHGVLVQVQSRAPIKLFTEKLPSGRFFVVRHIYVINMLYWRYMQSMKMSKSALDKIGQNIREGKAESVEIAISALNNWRESHGEILQKYYNYANILAKIIDKDNIIVAQRLKRLPTIVNKLKRFKDMRLSRMQDIAGIRIIVEDIKQLDLVDSVLRKNENLKRVKDYIRKPKSSGYRGKHYIFAENEMFVEVQLRTQIQHLWATALETVDVLLGTTLKENEDETYWCNFFRQVSSIFAIVEEKPVLEEHKHLDIRKMRENLKQNMDDNKISQKLYSYMIADPVIHAKNIAEAYYLVITLKPETNEVVVMGFKENQYDIAFEKYKSIERNNQTSQQTVLVGVNQINKIKEIYPNYYINLYNFVQTIKFIISEK